MVNVRITGVILKPCGTRDSSDLLVVKLLKLGGSQI